MLQTAMLSTSSLVANHQVELLNEDDDIKNRISLKGCNKKHEIEYYSFTSSAPKKNVPTVVTVHGIGRKAYEQAKKFAPYVEAYGGTLIAPVFRKKDFNNYQQLGFPGKGLRADFALKKVITEESRNQGRTDQKVVLFGYSGGGQFAHRFAMAYPRQVIRLAVAAPGWFTYPDPNSKFPLGIGGNEELPDLHFDLSRILQIPTLVLVGEKDILRGKGFNSSKEIDDLQGKDRLERCRRWIKAISSVSKRFNFKTDYEFEVLADCGHSFIECAEIGNLTERVIHFLFKEQSRHTHTL